MSDTESSEQDARIVSLEEMIAHDSSILTLADLPLGYKAERTKETDQWQINRIS